MIVGDSPQSLLGRMSQPDAADYTANRQQYGINTLWVNLLCNDATACNADGTTFDGTAPFTTPRDVSTPNPAYFEHADNMLKIAADDHVERRRDVRLARYFQSKWCRQGSGVRVRRRQSV
jgi:hypothetical protein